MAPSDHARASARLSEPSTPAADHSRHLRILGWPRVRRWLREPLWIFLLIALSLFAIERAVRRPGSDASIAADEAKRSELAALFQQRQGRKPTAAETRALVQSYLDDEVLVREALKIELLRRDPALRDQVIARMRALLATSSREQEPTEPILRRYFEAHRSSYGAPELVSLTEYVIPNSPAAEDEARETLRSLQHERAVDRQDRPAATAERSEQELEQLYGRAFVDAVRALPVGAWQLLRSPRAVHVLRVERRTPASLPAYEEVLQRVREDYRIAEDQRRLREQLARLRESYDVAEPAP